MQSHLLVVCVVGVGTAAIYGVEIDILERVRRDNVALPISYSEPKVTLELEADFGNAPTKAEEQKNLGEARRLLA